MLKSNLRFMYLFSTLSLSILAFSACSSVNTQSSILALHSQELETAMSTMQADALESHIRILADDSMLGRAPGTAGFTSAIEYVEENLREFGLLPAGENNSYRQAVPLRNATIVEDESSLSVFTTAGRQTMTYGVDYYMGADMLRANTELDAANVVFVGFGVSAPALGHDDYGDIDVRGKVVLYLSGAPTDFPSNERAYYSSGGTKTAEAIQRGAIGALTFWAPDDPRLRWDVNVNRSKRGAYAWLDEEGVPNRGNIQLLGTASLNHSAARALFAGASTSIDDAISKSQAGEPQAFELASRVSLRSATTHRDVDSWNLVAKLEGSDPALRDEYVTYVAHVDHLGVGVEVDGDAIYNGAHDNASGTGIVLEIARAFATLPEAPRRSILFVFVTAEEWGLLGSDYFAENPTVPASSIVNNFSLDMPFLFHPLLDIVPYGAEHSSLGQSVRAAASYLDIAIAEDPIPEQVLFIRSDHFSFIRRGIPALFIKSGFETGDERDGAAINTGFRQERYHTPFDEIDQGFDFGAGVSHAAVNFLTGYIVAQEESRPSWNEGDFFGELFNKN